MNPRIGLLALSRTLLVLALALLPIAASAVVFFDNGAPNDPADSFGFFSDPDALQLVGESFNLAAPATVRRVRWYGNYGFTDTPQVIDAFTIEFYAHPAGPPDPVLASDLLRSETPGYVSRVLVGFNSDSGVYVYQYTAEIADLALAAGDYLISITNDTSSDANDDWLWETHATVGGNVYGQLPSTDWQFADDEPLAFSLSDGDDEYDLIAHDPASGKRIAAGYITTDGSLGTGLDPLSVISDYRAFLDDGTTFTRIDFATDGVAEFDGRIAATASELSLDATANFDLWCLSADCGAPNAVAYRHRTSFPSQMELFIYANGPGPSIGLVDTRLIAAAAVEQSLQEIRLDLDSSALLPANWNTLSANATASNLLDFATGLGTGVDATTAGFASYDFDANLWTAGDEGWIAEDAGRSGGFLFSAGSATVTFSNLTSDHYAVEVAASNATGFADSVADISVNGSFADTDEYALGENGDDYPLDGNGHDNWLTWDAVAPVAGEIVVSMDFASGTNGTVINAVRLVPEPGRASGLACGLAALALLRATRRRA